ncbi:enoyl-CoA hydratase/isomerase family protein [Natronococcus wangiae]|uniref:enoyl-CoA hydratase/isomerase family protein n=1 Tax=Natronococcus wangiae TaxID=3068275 RepID=UPI00273D80AE|nr:enoyl-CoA hydratase/isomerase family protein [Natronococcus sp. AD5]
MVNADFTVDDYAAYITVQRAEKLNAIDTSTKTEIIDRLRQYKDDEAVRVVVFQSDGDRAFCAGGDVREIPETDYSLKHFTDSWDELFATMRNLGLPTVAKVDGVALGGGFDWLLHTDFVVAASDAEVGQPEIDLGIVNHFSPPVLLDQVGVRKTMELLLTGETISGAEAAEIGLVTRSVPREELDEAVDSLVSTLVNKNPRVVEKIKDGIYTSLEMSPSAAKSHLEDVSLESARTDPDYREGVDAQLAGRDPEWTVK